MVWRPLGVMMLLLILAARGSLASAFGSCTLRRVSQNQGRRQMGFHFFLILRNSRVHPVGWLSPSSLLLGRLRKKEYKFAGPQEVWRKENKKTSHFTFFVDNRPTEWNISATALYSRYRHGLRGSRLQLEECKFSTPRPSFSESRSSR